MLIGLAGKSCSGKNLTGNILEEQGAVHLDLDKINHIILEREAPQLAALFGNQVIDQNGSLDRVELANIVFSNKEKLHILEEFVHPLIDREVKKIIENKKKDKIIVINGAVLHKSSLIHDFDIILYTQSFLILRLLRAFKRDGFHPLKISKRFFNQRGLGTQLFLSDVDIYKVNNNRNKKVLERVISALLHKLSK